MKNRKGLFIALGIIGMAIIAAYSLGLIGNNDLEELKAIEINDLNLEKIDDGVYSGTFYYKENIGATLLVTINDHEITDIDIYDSSSARGEMAAAVVEDIIARQTLHVDDVAGATISSRIYILAVQEALEDKQ